MPTFNTLKPNQICSLIFVGVFGAVCSWLRLWRRLPSLSCHTQDVQEELFDNDSLHCFNGALSAPVRKANASNNPKATYGSYSVTTKFPTSVSIASLREAGKLVKSVAKKKLLLNFEQLDVASRQWKDAVKVECAVDSEKFSSGGFRDSEHCVLTGKSTKQNIPDHWVIKMYNDKSKEAIGSQFNTNIESHCRKKVQIHDVAGHLTKKFKSQAPKEMGECFQYKHVYFRGTQRPFSGKYLFGAL